MIRDIPSATDRDYERLRSTLLCREITEADIDQIIPFFSEPDRDIREHIDFNFEISSDDKWRELLTDYYLGEDANGYVVEEEGHIVGVGGSISGSRIQCLPPHDKDSSIYLRGVAVKPEVRGRGVGRTLVATLLEEAFQQKGVTSTYAWIIDDARVSDWRPAYNMLRKAGFRISPFLPHWRDWGLLGFHPENDPDTLLFKMTREQYDQQAQSRAIKS